MEMHQVRYFITLCDELNFTRAAEKCNVAQPALTRAIKLLENEFGGHLFHRERARTHLTELGAAVRPYLVEVRQQAQQAKKLASSLIELKGTRLKLGIMCTIRTYKTKALLKFECIRVLLAHAVLVVGQTDHQISAAVYSNLEVLEVERCDALSKIHVCRTPQHRARS